MFWCKHCRALYEQAWHDGKWWYCGDCMADREARQLKKRRKKWPRS